MKTFAEFLRDSSQLPAERIAEYEQWARMSQAETAGPGKNPGGTQEGLYSSPAPFLDSLARTQGKVTVARARHAIQLYWYYVREFGPRAPAVRSTTLLVPARADRLILDKMQRLIRLEHLAYRTEQTYMGWAERFFAFTGPRASAPGLDELKCFLSHLAVDRKVAAATQKQAFNALLYLFRNVLAVPIEGLECVVRAKVGKRLPWFSPNSMGGTDQLMATLIYGGGLRLDECLSLRVKDIDFNRSCLSIRYGKGNKDRETVLPRRWSVSCGAISRTCALFMKVTGPGTSRAYGFLMRSR